MKSSKTSFLRNCISGWNVRGQTLDTLTLPKKMYLWRSNISNTYVSLCNESHTLPYRDYSSSLQ